MLWSAWGDYVVSYQTSTVLDTHSGHGYPFWTLGRISAITQHWGYSESSKFVDIFHRILVISSQNLVRKDPHMAEKFDVRCQLLLIFTLLLSVRKSVLSHLFTSHSCFLGRRLLYYLKNLHARLERV